MIQNIIIRLISIPREFNNGNISVYEIVKDSGYFDVASQISEQDICEALILHIDCVDDWLVYSSDQRCTPSWFIMPDKANGYTVGYYGEHQVIESTYNDKLEACASFIKHHLDQIVSNHNNW